VNVEVRQIAFDDRAALALGRAAGLEDAESDIEGMLARWGAFERDRLVGTIALRHCEGMYVIAWTAVADDRRGEGLGSRLLEVAEDEASRRGAARLWVLARAPGFYLRSGYEPVDACREQQLLLGPCEGCGQFGATCHPRVAAKDLAPR